MKPSCLLRKYLLYTIILLLPVSILFLMQTAANSIKQLTALEPISIADKVCLADGDMV